MDWKKLDN
jgi:dynein heavy chain